MSQQQLSERAERLRGAADEAARLVHGSYLSFLLLGTYIAVILGSTTDVQLLKSSPVTLPLLNVPIPIRGFYLFAPWLLLLVYFNLLLQLTLLAQKLHRLNVVLGAFTDEAVREDQYTRLFPFPFSNMLIGPQAPWRLRGLLGLMIGTTVVLLPLGLLLWAQVRFLPYHEEAITWIHRAAVLADLALLWLFWPLMLRPEPREDVAAQDSPRGARRAFRTRRLRWGTGVSGLTLVTVVFSLGIAVVPEEGMEGWMVSLVSRLSPDFVHTEAARADQGVFTLTFWLFDAPRSPFHRNLRLREQVLVAGDPSAKVIAALHSADEAKRAQGLDEIAGLILTNRDLRGADLRETLFPKADLRGANLNGANLRGARVFAGNLSAFQISQGERCVGITDTHLQRCQTSLQGTHLWETQLQGADLQHAQLQGADLSGAELEGATLQYAQLQGADLGRAALQGADLRDANIGSADFTDADLRWSDLRGLWLGPLEKKVAEALKQELTAVIRDVHRRADALARIASAASGNPPKLQAIAPAKEVLCNKDDKLPFRCLAREQMVEYARARARLLGDFGCQSDLIARSLMARHLSPMPGVIEQPEPALRVAFAKHVTAIPEKDCPGWTAVPADWKEKLRQLAAEEP